MAPSPTTPQLMTRNEGSSLDVSVRKKATKIKITSSKTSSTPIELRKIPLVARKPALKTSELISKINNLQHSQRLGNSGWVQPQAVRVIPNMDPIFADYSIGSRAVPSLSNSISSTIPSKLPLKQQSVGPISSMFNSSTWPPPAASSPGALRLYGFFNPLACTHTPKPVNIKKERALQKVLEESKPRNDLEAGVLNHLRDMGFMDTTTNLSAIRTVYSRLTSNDNDDDVMVVPSVEELADKVMMFLLAQKEELEEAAYLDIARISSERDKEVEQKKKLADQQKLVQSMPSVTVLKSYFGQSQLLKHDNMYQILELLWAHEIKSRSKTNESLRQTKRLVVEVLLLEQKAIRWYGSSQGPNAYMMFVLAPGFVEAALSGMKKKAKSVNDIKLNLPTAKSMAAYLTHQVDAIQRGLYSLEEQQGSIPKMFVQANRDAKTNKSWSSDICDHIDSNEQMEDDDSIEIVEMEINSVSNATPRKPVEIIELLD